MGEKVILNGDRWKLTGFWKNHWRLIRSMETGIKVKGVIPTIQAEVPGAVQLDLIKAGILKDPNYGLNSNLGEWVNNREWFLDTEFVLPEDKRGEKYILCFEGLDYHGEVYLNGKLLGKFCRMFIPHEFDITGILKTEGTNFLRVVFCSTPEVDGQVGYSNQIKILKSRFNYQWDWCPRIVPVGIWDDVYIKIYNYVRIVDFFPRTSVDETYRSGKIDMHVELDADISGEYIFVYRVLLDGKEICRGEFNENLIAAKGQRITHEVFVDNIKLWWPNSFGEQPLYNVEVAIYNKENVKCDNAAKRVGFRRVEFLKNVNSSDDSLPYTLVLNGKRIFLRGVNWVPISPFYGGVRKQDYVNYIKRFKDMNCNVLRVWGGAILEKEDFYDVCDEMGIMIWQEFPQSSSGLNNTPPDNPEFLEELKKVATVFIKRRRHHASHIIWCGGNELMWENAKPVDFNHINIKMLKELVEQLDPGKYFLPSSASGPKFMADEENFGKGVHHDVHGPWNYLGEPRHYRFFNGDDSLFRSETGCAGISRLDTLDKYRGEYQLWPPDETNLLWMHRGAWWLQLKELTELFGEWSKEELPLYVEASRFVQAEALRYAVEATRRREPQSSGFIVWMGNESFPNFANTSLLEYDGTPKPAYYWVRSAYSKVHVSLRYDNVCYVSGEGFEGDVYVTYDYEEPNVYEICAQVLDVYGHIRCQSKWEKGIYGPVTFVGRLSWYIENCPQNVFFVRVILKGQEGSLIDENTYIFTVDSQNPFGPLRSLPPADVVIKEVDIHGGLWTVKNVSCVVAVGVFLYGQKPNEFMSFSSNYFILMPGEEKRITIQTRNGYTIDKNFNVSGFNVRLIG
ncbi:beta-mannosidase [Caldicoprobacter guelmensis]|uniref:glycoside hydrolase family 2 protein n=1 Tax=Caldicoprobacter guelmensis TaxID=1170224 RepID=UPI00195C628B|nr:glycoside hydrolase family 2 TIM barrel-domain containing protein [Caldicoprobacter guelmensis]MBM7582950.1 beta-mannosidase [Caldicoprobacter guelmensis]